jgi:hypothetical protein
VENEGSDIFLSTIAIFKQFILLVEAGEIRNLHSLAMENVLAHRSNTLKSHHMWQHPTLALHLPDEDQNFETPKAHRLYLVPTPHFYGEDDENVDQPQPSPLSQLPQVEEWMNKFTLSVIEIFAGKRSIAQLNRWCHHRAFFQLGSINKMITSKKLPPLKIRKIYINQPIEGVIEATVTLRVVDRVRSMSIRCEGLDGRWICTDIALI